MKIYSSYGVKDFIICCGYKGYVIKEYFFKLLHAHIRCHFCLDENNKMEVHHKKTKLESNAIDKANLLILEVAAHKSLLDEDN